MSTVSSHVRLPTDFFRQLRVGAVRVLLLDYDGTLAPFATERQRAKPYPGIIGLLSRIVGECGTRVVIVSGRPAHDVPQLLRVKFPLEIWGCHGCERLLPDGSYQCEELTAGAQHTVAEALEWLDREGLAGRIEHKPSGLAVHWRGLSAGDANEVRVGAFRALWPLRRTGMIFAEFDGGLELRASERDKAHVVRTVLRESGPEACVACLGDDATDEDAFRALKGRGLSLLVRSEFRPTSADLWIKPPEELLRFLEHWIEVCGGAL